MPYPDADIKRAYGEDLLKRHRRRRERPAVVLVETGDKLGVVDLAGVVGVVAVVALRLAGVGRVGVREPHGRLHQFEADRTVGRAHRC